VGHLRESYFTDSCADNSDCFNDLSSELLVLRLMELAEISNQEVKCVLEVWDKMLTSFFNDGCEGRRGIFFYD
jgi:hypothetical protein